MEASALQAPVGIARRRSTIGLAVLRLRSDEQLVALLRSGHDEAFVVIHDRYHQRLFAYMRQMLPLRQDVEDALQEVFERAYANLCTGDRELALRPWLYRIAHNRCIDHLRRPLPPPPETMLQLGPPSSDPVQEADRREAVRRLMADVQRLPDQQRSALLMRELGGIPYADVAAALGVTVPAVKSLLVRARLSLVQSVEARDTACAEIRAELVHAHEERMRPNAMARRHMRDCPGCREFRGHLRGVRRQLLALAPGLGPCAVLARLLGGHGGTSGGAAAACGGATGLAGGATGVAGTGGILASAGALATGAGHVATIIAATVVTAGGAAEIQHTIVPTHHHPARPTAHAAAPTNGTGPAGPATTAPGVATANAIAAAPAASTAIPTAAMPAANQAPPAAHRVRVAAGDPSGGELAPIPDLPSSIPASAGSGSTSTSAAGPGTGTDGSGTSTPGTSTPTAATGSSPATSTGTSPGATGPSDSTSGSAPTSQSGTPSPGTGTTMPSGSSTSSGSPTSSSTPGGTGQSGSTPS